MCARNPKAKAAAPAAIAAALAAQLSQRSLRLSKACGGGEPDQIAVACRDLIGLGPGLTPAGDDFLVGFCITAIWLNGRESAVPAALSHALHAAAGATPSLSAVALADAAEGRVPQIILDLLGSLSEPSLTAACTKRLLSFGHTSGTDIAQGISSALTLYRPEGVA